jgi:hypothetical protein
MIVIQADFDHRDASGRLRLADLEVHRDTPFADLAAWAEQVLFVDGEDAAYGRLILEPGAGWLGDVDWSTQQTVESWPPATVGAH